MIEPEVVWHILCPEAEILGDGEASELLTPAMILTERHDDVAGQQRVYTCPRCQTSVAVTFPPEG